MSGQTQFANIGLLTGSEILKELDHLLAPLEMGVFTNLWINLYGKGRNEVRCHTEKWSSVRLTFHEQIATVPPFLTSNPAGRVVTLYNVPNRMAALADQVDELLAAAAIEGEFSPKLSRLAIDWRGQLEVLLINLLTKAEYTFVLTVDQPLPELPKLLGHYVQGLPRLTNHNQDEYIEEVNDKLREKRFPIRVERITINGAYCTVYDSNGEIWDDLIVMQSPQGLTSELLDALEE